jgi:hypothetical protein
MVSIRDEIIKEINTKGYKGPFLPYPVCMKFMKKTCKMYFVLFNQAFIIFCVPFSSYGLGGILKLVQTIYTRGICIYTSSSQEKFLPRVRANTLGKMQLPQVIADLFKIWKMRDHWNTPGKARVYPG